MNGRILALGMVVCTSSMLAFAAETGESELSLWQIQYEAPTSYQDGYTVKGKAKSFKGSFTFKNGQLLALEGSVPIKSLSSGLEARDASVRELVFTTTDGRLPDLKFEAQKTICKKEDAAWACPAKGRFRVRDEWQNVEVLVYVSDYQGRPWLHAEGMIQLSKYNFYAQGSKALKVADKVNIAIDLLGP